MQSFVDQYWTSYLDRIEAKPSTRKPCWTACKSRGRLAQKLLGHSRYQTTANIYTHSSSEQEREAALAVEQAIFGESVRNIRENANNQGSQVIN
jgi:hypothetical protein